MQHNVARRILETVAESVSGFSLRLQLLLRSRAIQTGLFARKGRV